MDTVNLKVEGMSCTNCALTIHKYLERQGLQNVKVNFAAGNVTFDPDSHISVQQLQKGIAGLGYHVVTDERVSKKPRLLKNNFQRFLFCLVFFAPLMLHMTGIHIHWLMTPYAQLALTVPVYLTGMFYFGTSAWRSALKGIPNMNVLIALGATASFIYSLYGTLTGQPEQFMFYETTAGIITLIFLGNWLEDKSVETTQAALKKLAVYQKAVANIITYDKDGNEHLVQRGNEEVNIDNLVLIRTGEQVPTDCKIFWGEVSVNEALLTGESIPVEKAPGDDLVGGSIVEAGTVKARVTAAGQNTVMSHIIKLINDAQAEKPPVQQLADKISVVFVPVVVGIAIATFLLNYFLIDVTFTASLLRAIAVLVIACPCAMGLATPAAIAVGLGRAARNGVLFKNAKSLEVFKDIRQVVFDKTGTLTTGNFKISNSKFFKDEDFVKRIAFSLEKYSNHPIAKAIAQSFERKDEIKWSAVEEIKGFGMRATDNDGNVYVAGSFAVTKHVTSDASHSVYITKNDELLAWLDVEDEIRSEAQHVISLLKAKNIKTILLSGDRKEKCEAVAARLGIDEIYAGQTPQQKLQTIEALNQQAPTAMVGDGINDGPALAKATVGISLSDASHIAMQSAQVVLMNNGLKNLPLSLGLGKHTFTTIKQNLFWAFFYNIVAIPVAAVGLLTPTFAALMMGLSDVVLAINSIRLNWKKVV